ncbi:MAG: flippase-like domain-containing protein [Spirochaetales bacterium]|nr:flippase-like domain-containing protein [Spirochaetales bacterium]
MANSPGRKKLFRVVLGFILSGLVVLVLLKRISLHSVLHILTNTSKPLALIALLPYFLEYAFPSWRLILLTQTSKQRISLLTAYRINLVTAFGNYILPFRAGEVVKIFAIANSSIHKDISKSEAAGFVLVERILDLAIIIVIFFFGLYINQIKEIQGYYFILFGFLLSAMLLFLVLMIKKNKTFLLFIGKLPDRKNVVKLKYSLRRLGRVFSSLDEPIKWIFLIISTLLYWCVVLFSYWFAFYCINQSIGIKESLLIMAIGTLGIAIPAGPGSIGVLQGAFVVGGTFLDIPAENCFAAGIFYQGVQAVFILLLGGFSTITYRERIK